MPRLTFVALVDVDVALRPYEPLGAGAVVAAGDHVRLADCAGVARVRGACVVEVTEQSCLPRRALAVVVGHPVVARAPVQAGLLGAVVDVALAVLPVVAGNEEFWNEIFDFLILKHIQTHNLVSQHINRF